jgi:hypothetical protein
MDWWLCVFPLHKPVSSTLLNFLCLNFLSNKTILPQKKMYKVGYSHTEVHSVISFKGWNLFSELVFHLCCRWLFAGSYDRCTYMQHIKLLLPTNNYICINVVVHNSEPLKLMLNEEVWETLRSTNLFRIIVYPKKAASTFLSHISVICHQNDIDTH